MNDYILPNWPAPSHVKALTTTRQSGYSEGAFHSFNLAMHVNDTPEHVAENRTKLVTDWHLINTPGWLNQVHSNTVIELSEECVTTPTADASVTRIPHLPCVVMTADCLPILLCDKEGTCVSAVHAGWRGLANGIIENAVSTMQRDCHSLMAWLGPAIGFEKFEVGEDVLEAFTTLNPEAQMHFKPIKQGKWLANLYGLAQQILEQMNISVYGSEYCTYTDEQLFYSYRRDNNNTGRMATLIWLET